MYINLKVDYKAEHWWKKDSERNMFQTLVFSIGNTSSKFHDFCFTAKKKKVDEFNKVTC